MNLKEENIDAKLAANIRISVKVFFFISGFIFATWASRIPALQQKLQLSDAELGSLLSTLPAGLMVSMPLAAYLVSKFNSRHIMLIGAILYVSLLCFVGLATNTWQVAIILFVFGASRNLFNISINTQSIGVQELYDKSIIASFHGIWSIAGFTGAAFASLLISLGVLPIYHFIIVGSIVLFLIVLFWGTTLKSQTAKTNNGPVFVLPDKVLMKLGLIAFCSMICEGTMSDWSGIYFSKVLHASKEMVNMGYVAYLSCMTTGRLIGDWMANKFGKKKLLFFSSLLLCIGAGMIAFFHAIGPAILGFMFCGLGVSCIVPFVFSIAGTNASMPRSSAIAAVSTIGYFGFLIGPPFIGFLSSAVGLASSYLFIMMMAAVIGYLVSRIKSPTSQF